MPDSFKVVSPAVRAARNACAFALVAAFSLMLTACSSGSNSGSGSGGVSPTPGVAFKVGSSCDLEYVLTNSPLLTGADPYLADQWHLPLIQAQAAWSMTRGAGIRVAVVDDSVELTHPDLQPNVVAGASHSYRPGNPYVQWPMPCSSATDDHGTSVAGLVLARDDNAIGGAGVAPRASLVAFDALSTSYDTDIADALTRDWASNSIYSNSWGSPDSGRTHPAPASFVNAIANGLAFGRSNLGSIYVFPGGNGKCFREDPSKGCQDDNANLDGFVNQQGIVTVCAVNSSGVSPWYGESGANLLVCAPSSDEDTSLVPVFTGITTTAIQAGYRNDFSGTSASVPQVSGVVALMLARNPKLSWRDVRLILASTAQKNDPSDPGWLPASIGRGFNHRYGYGVVDAQAAVTMASNWPTVGGSGSLTRCDWVDGRSNLPIPDAPVSGGDRPLDSVTISASACRVSQIEFVELKLTTSHAYTGDLQVRLTSPQGRVSELAQTRTCEGNGSSRGDDCGGYNGWIFGSARHMNESAPGAWSLSVIDPVPGNAGRVVSWSLRIHGR